MRQNEIDMTPDPAELEKRKTIAEIARSELGFSTLNIRDSDRLDWRECSVRDIESSLRKAYTAGVRAALALARR